MRPAVVLLLVLGTVTACVPHPIPPRRLPAGAIEFRLRAPGARSVSVVGSFNAWDPEGTPMTDAGQGLWRVALSLAPGRYEYSFVVDGAVAQPLDAPRLEPDAFGGRNGVLLVPEDFANGM